MYDLPVDYNKLTPFQRKETRVAYMVLQGGVCCYCIQSLYGPPSESVLSKPVSAELFPPNFFKWPIHLHHDHETGMTIGAVHALCNAVLWQYHGE